MKYNTLYPVVLNDNKNKVFVETGLWRGHGIQVALDCGFEQVFSCDIDPTAIYLAKKLYENNPKVKFFHLDSINYLNYFFDTYNITENITFWLDAHDYEGQKSAIYDELTLIKEKCKNKNNIIMIDDYNHIEKWSINKEKLNKSILDINENFKIKVQPRIYSEIGDINDPKLPVKGSILIGKL